MCVVRLRARVAALRRCCRAARTDSLQRREGGALRLRRVLRQLRIKLGVLLLRQLREQRLVLLLASCAALRTASHPSCAWSRRVDFFSKLFCHAAFACTCRALSRSTVPAMVRGAALLSLRRRIAHSLDDALLPASSLQSSAAAAAPSSSAGGAGGGGGGARRGGTPSVDLERLINARVRVRFAGGRELVGVLKGYDQLVNLVLDEAVEYLRGERRGGCVGACLLRAARAACGQRCRPRHRKLHLRRPLCRPPPPPPPPARARSPRQTPPTRRGCWTRRAGWASSSAAGPTSPCSRRTMVWRRLPTPLAAAMRSEAEPARAAAGGGPRRLCNVAIAPRAAAGALQSSRTRRAAINTGCRFQRALCLRAACAQHYSRGRDAV